MVLSILTSSHKSMVPSSMTTNRVFCKVFKLKQEMAQPPRFGKNRFIDNSSAKFICIYFDDNLTADCPVCFVDVKIHSDKQFDYIYFQNKTK